MVPEPTIFFLHGATKLAQPVEWSDVSAGTHRQRAAGPATKLYSGVNVTVSP
jgi:hypothetical protein